MNSKDTILNQLRNLNLSNDEAQVYLELLKGPASHLKLARGTGINRSKVYRLADDLEKRSLISVRSDDRGTFLVAADPATLEVELVTEEENLRGKRQAFEQLLPALQLIKNNDESKFIVHTYEGEEGFKQMLWHELKATQELLMFGRASLSDLIASQRWITQHKERLAHAAYDMCVLVNPGEDNNIFTVATNFQARVIAADILPLETQITVYNDVVAFYHWRQQQKVGVEIINKPLAQTMRGLFDTFWKLAEEQPGAATPAKA